MLGVGSKVKIVMWTKAPLSWGPRHPCKTHTRGVELAWQLHLFLEMCMWKEMGSDIEVRVLTLEVKYPLGSE